MGWVRVLALPQLLWRDGKFFLPVNYCVWRLLPAQPHISIARSWAGLWPGPTGHAKQAKEGTVTPRCCDPPLGQAAQEKAALVNVTAEARLVLRDSK